MTPIEALERRLRRIEDIDAIRQLKARYFTCCDRKDPHGMRACFAPGVVRIDYGRIGTFDHRDELVDVFERLACHPHIVEQHHGTNPVIAVLDDAHARGTWGLCYQAIDMQARTLTQLGAYYDDTYRKIDGAWMIAGTRCVVTSTLSARYDGEAAGVLFAGAQPPLA